MELNKKTRCPYCKGKLSEVRTNGEKYWQHCYSCHFEFPIPIIDNSNELKEYLKKE